jgi:hypothetical protein
MHLRRRPSYASIVSTLALVIAIGGGSAWAATHRHYLITNTGQIKPRVLKKLRGHNGKDGTNGLNGAKGASGPAGPMGATGATGVTGVAGIVTATSTNVTLSAMDMPVVDATAPLTGNLLVLGQVSGLETNPQGDGQVSCSIVDVTAAPGTLLGSAGATFAKETLVSSSVDVAVQAKVAARKGDTISIECVAGSLGYSAPSSNIALVPMA